MDVSFVKFKMIIVILFEHRNINSVIQPRKIYITLLSETIRPIKWGRNVTQNMRCFLFVEIFWCLLLLYDRKYLNGVILILTFNLI